MTTMTTNDDSPFDQAALDTLSDYTARPAPLCPWGCKPADQQLQVVVPRPLHPFTHMRYVCDVCRRRFSAYMWWERVKGGLLQRHLEYEPGWHPEVLRQAGQCIAGNAVAGHQDRGSVALPDGMRVPLVIPEGWRFPSWDFKAFDRQTCASGLKVYVRPCAPAEMPPGMSAAPTEWLLVREVFPGARTKQPIELDLPE